MITFLRKLFIKNYQDTSSQKVREAHGILASCGGILVNLVLFAFKLLIGIITVSMSVISDAINNLTDFFSCIVNLIGFKVASKPADKDHPFGHERIEYLSGLIISFVIVAAGLLLIYSSISALLEGSSEISINIYTFIILSVSIVIKLGLGLFYRGLGKAINSVSLKASMQDSLNDALVTTFVLICSIIQFYFPSLWYLDAAVSIVVSLFVLFAGAKMIKETSAPLIGVRPEVKNVLKVKEEVLKIPGVLGVHDMVFHSYGPTKVFLTIHIEVDGNMNLFKSHDIADEVEHLVKTKFMLDATVHIDPIDVESPEYQELKEKITKIIRSIDETLSFHDLRIIKSSSGNRVSFDIALPIDYKCKKSDLAKKIREAINEIDKTYVVVINFDDNYVG